MWLTDDLTQLKWQIPNGTVISADSVLNVWCDEDGTQGPMHANFKLSSSGEEIGLFNAAGTAIHESIVYGQQQVDVATGRLFDGALPWVMLPAPTYDATNQPTACGQRTYGGLDPTEHGVSLTLLGSLQIGTTGLYDIQNGPANGTAIGAMSLVADSFDLSAFGVDETYLLSPTAAVIAGVLALNGSGGSSWSLPIPNNASFVGLPIYAQALTTSGAAFDSSNAIELRICP